MHDSAGFQVFLPGLIRCQQAFILQAYPKPGGAAGDIQDIFRAAQRLDDPLFQRFSRRLSIV